MTAIAGSTVRVQTMADDTLRLVIDIEPRHAKEAFSLFGSCGTAVAIAALVASTEPEPEPMTEPEQPKGGPLAKWAGMRCREPEFQRWIGASSYENAAYLLRALCNVESRVELDNNAEAAERMKTRIVRPWQAHCSTLAT